VAALSIPGIRSAAFKSGFAECAHVRVQQRAVQRGFSGGGGARKREVNLQVAAHHAGFEDAANGGFQRIHFRRQVEMQVQPAVVDALQTQRQLALLHGAPHPREARHAAYLHYSTASPAVTNCNSCSRR